MATYISLVRWTDQGIRNVKESPARLEAAKELFRSQGAEMKQFYLVQGSYDMIVVFEAPDDETVARAALAVGSRGSSRTETFRAFTEDEYRGIVGALV
jgi:uncharacterized protein with GYD domain